MQEMFLQAAVQSVPESTQNAVERNERLQMLVGELLRKNQDLRFEVARLHGEMQGGSFAGSLLGLNLAGRKLLPFGAFARSVRDDVFLSRHFHQTPG